MVWKALWLHFFEDHTGPTDLGYSIIVIIYKHSVPTALNSYSASEIDLNTRIIGSSMSGEDGGEAKRQK